MKSARVVVMLSWPSAAVAFSSSFAAHASCGAGCMTVAMGRGRVVAVGARLIAGGAWSVGGCRKRGRDRLCFGKAARQYEDEGRQRQAQ